MVSETKHIIAHKHDIIIVTESEDEKKLKFPNEMKVPNDIIDLRNKSIGILHSMIINQSCNQPEFSIKKTELKRNLSSKIYVFIFYSTFTTFSISGACCLMLFSTPNFNVEKLREQAEQFPKSFTKTVFSFTSKSSMSPPSLFKNGRMLSRASITRVTVSSCVIFVSIFGFGFQKYF